MRCSEDITSNRFRGNGIPAIVVCLILASVGLFVPGTALGAGGLLTGVNVVNPQRRDAAVQQRTLDELTRAGVRTIRVPLSVPYPASVDFARRASARGLAVVLAIMTANPRAARPGVVPRDGHGATWAMLPLSGLAPRPFLDDLGEAFAELERNRVNIAAFEFGNEINWTPFNGDFPLPGRGRVLSLDELQSTGEGGAIAAGYDVYLELLRGVRRRLDRSPVYRRTPLISAGLSDPGPSGPRRGRTMDAVSVEATLQYLKARGLDRLVQGYGVHFYPRTDAGEANADARLDAVLDLCSPAADSAAKPCWLTEWGLRADPGDCGDAGPRPRLAAALIEGFKRYAAAGRLRAAIYYAWGEGAGRFAVFRCGRLSPTGRAVLDGGS